MKQLTESKSLTVTVECRHVPPECARAPSGKCIPGYQSTDGVDAPETVGTVVLLRAPRHLDSKLSYLRDFSRKIHASPSGTQCLLTEMKVICKKFSPSRRCKTCFQ